MSTSEIPSANIQLAEILSRQGMDPTLEPDDVHMIDIIERPDDTSSYRQTWYAIPKEITVRNPLTDKNEVGELHENGAFVAETASVKRSSLQPRAMILGNSTLKSASVGVGTVVNAATIWHSYLENNVSVDADTTLLGGDTFCHPQIKDGVKIGKSVHVSFETSIGSESTIGDEVMITNSIIGEHVMIAKTDKSSKHELPEPFKDRGHTTFIGRSKIGRRAFIGTNSQIESADISSYAVLEDHVYVQDTEFPVPGTMNLYVPAGSVLIKEQDRHETNELKPEQAPRAKRRFFRF